MTEKTRPLWRATQSIRNGNTLTSDEIAGAFRIIMGGGATDGMIGAFLGILATRIPTHEELYGASTVMKECVHRVDLPNPSDLLDTCGTGGAPKTFNVSTAAGIVAAGCGVRVAKHGNRSRTGRGSAEVLEQLGINIDATPEQQKRSLDEAGICFCFAPKHHSAVAHVMPVRKELGFPTIFNLLGPLTNPCSAGRQLLGVWDDQYVMPIAESLRDAGTTHSAVIHSSDGLDEISISAPTRIVFVHGQTITESEIEPSSLNLGAWTLEDVTADSLETATNYIRRALVQGEKGAPRDMILLSAAACLILADRVQTMSDGVSMAANSIDSGQTATVLQRWAEASHANIPSTDN